MENHHQKIKEYRDLKEAEIDLMNEVKEAGARLSVLVDKLAADEQMDQRWVEIGRTDLQKGLMALGRSVAKPGSF